MSTNYDTRLFQNRESHFSLTNNTRKINTQNYTSGTRRFRRVCEKRCEGRCEYTSRGCSLLTRRLHHTTTIHDGGSRYEGRLSVEDMIAESVSFRVRHRNERISILRCCSRCHDTSCRGSHCKTATTTMTMTTTTRERGKKTLRADWETRRGWKHTLAGCELRARARVMSCYLGHATRDLFDFEQDDVRCICDDSESAISTLIFSYPDQLILIISYFSRNKSLCRKKTRI